MRDELKEMCGLALILFSATPVVSYFGGDIETAKMMLPNVGLTIIAVVFLMYVLVPLVDLFISRAKK